MNLSTFFILFISPVLAYQEGENMSIYEHSQFFIPGSWVNIPINDIVRNESMFGAKQISYSMNSTFHYKLIDIIESQRQIVAGINYRIKISIQETLCPKAIISFEMAQRCELDDEEALKYCTVLIYVIPWKSKRKVLSFNCSDSETQKEMMSSAEFHHDKVLFKKFMQKFRKTYSSINEKQYRFNIFRDNMKKIHELNFNEKGTAVYGITKFSDLSEAEFQKLLGFRPQLMINNFIPSPTKIPSFSIPNYFDWRDHNAVTEVKNQKACGSCWAFSTTGNIEGLWAIKKKQLLSLSEQELIDCDKIDHGCNGGLPFQAYHEIIRLGGLETEEEYPYEAKDDICRFDKSAVRVYINSSVVIATNETEMAIWLVKHGPISAGINAEAMQFYRGGISHPSRKNCDPNWFNLDHGVVIVGYGVQTFPSLGATIPFWIIKNSWGTDWGEEGYYRLYRGDGSCGIDQFPTSAVIE